MDLKGVIEVVMSKYKNKILELRKQGKSYIEIENILGCSRGTVSYHCGIGQKKKYKDRLKSYRNKNPIYKRMEGFLKKALAHKVKSCQMEYDNTKKNKRGRQIETKRNVDDFLEKFGPAFHCYLTGEKINLNEPKSYQFDHIIPISQGGESSLDNIGLTTKGANVSKNGMMLEEYVELCKRILEHNGFEVKLIDKGKLDSLYALGKRIEE